MAQSNAISSGLCCGFCGSTNGGNLQRCSRCRVMLYCNQEHQSSHRPDHRSACNRTAKRRDIVEEEERKLRNLEDEDILLFTQTNPFETSVGHFWGILPTRPYMRARFGLVDALRDVKTLDSVRAQLDHLMGMLRLCRSDNMGVRDLVPALMLRLNRDQGCYDFVKWYGTTGQRSDYDWGDMDLPYLDVKNADAFESVEYLCHDFPDLSHVVAVTLLKVRLLLDVVELQNMASGSETTMPLRSSIVAGNKDISDHAAVISKLTAQTDLLFKTVQRVNEFFWPSLLKPESDLTTRPNMYSQGSRQEMQLVLQYSYDSWIETPGAIQVIEERVKKGNSS